MATTADFPLFQSPTGQKLLESDPWNCDLVSEMFLKYCSDHRYLIIPGTPWLCENPFFLSSHSVIAPYLSEFVLKNLRLTRSAMVQQCFHQKPEKNSLYITKIQGIIGEFSQLMDTLSGQMEFLQFIGCPRENLHVVLMSDEEPIRSVAQAFFASTHIHFVHGAQKKYLVPSFNHQLKKTTLAIAGKVSEKSTEPLSDSFIPLGSVTIISNSEKTQYFEIAFDNNTLQSLFYGGQSFNIPYYRLQINIFKPQLEKQAKKFIKHLLAFISLHEAGVRTHEIRYAYIQKNLQRVIFNILADHHQDVAYVRATALKHLNTSMNHQWAPALDVLASQFQEYRDHRPVQEESAMEFLRGKIKTAPQKKIPFDCFKVVLKDSFYLSKQQIAHIREVLKDHFI